MSAQLSFESVTRQITGAGQRIASVVCTACSNNHRVQIMTKVHK